MAGMLLPLSYDPQASGLPFSGNGRTLTDDAAWLSLQTGGGAGVGAHGDLLGEFPIWGTGSA